MKRLLMALTALSMVGCGGGGGGGAATSTSTPWNSYSVSTSSELPTCSGDVVGRLYYIEDSDTFQVCKSSGWATIDVKGDDGADGTSGVSVSSVKTIGAATSTDYCTEVTGESCYFKGGQVTTFSDGSFMIQFKWMFSYVVAGDSDFDTTTSTLFFPSTWTGVSIPMSVAVARGAGYKTVYLVYFKSPESVTVWVDTDGSGAITGTDELLYTSTLTSL